MMLGQRKFIGALIAFMMAISFSTSIFVYAETPEERKKKEQQEQQKQQQQKQQQEQQRQRQQQEQQKQQQLQQQKQQQEQQRQRQQQEQQKQQQLQQQKQQQQQQQQRPQPAQPPVQKPQPQPGMQPGQPPIQKPQPQPQPGMQPGQPLIQKPQPQPGMQPGQPPIQKPQPQPQPGMQPGQPPIQKPQPQPGMQPGQPPIQKPQPQPQPGMQPGQPPIQKPQPQPGMQPGQPPIQKPQPQPQPGMQPGQPPVQKPQPQPGMQPGQVQKPQPGQPGHGPGQPNVNVREHTTVNKTVINIKQAPQERRRALTERQKEIRPEHNVRAAGHFQSERARFRPVSKVVVHHSPVVQRRVFERHHFHPETYHARRAVFYETYQFHTPGWAYRMQPRYGLWDTPALAFIVAHAADEQYALWYYNHRVDPDVIAWRQEMNRLAAENAELANQLTVMDAQAQALQSRGVPVDNSYVPPEMEDVALAAEVAVPAQDQPPALTIPQQLDQCRSDNDALQQQIDQLTDEVNRLSRQSQGSGGAYP